MHAWVACEVHACQCRASNEVSQTTPQSICMVLYFFLVVVNKKKMWLIVVF
jgi:hypothetical protein